MKDLKYATIVFVIGLALLAQLTSATQVHADGEAPPLPAYTPAAVDTSLETEAPTEIPLIEASTPEPISDTPAPANSSVPDTASNTPLPAATNLPTSAPTDGTLVESPTPEVASSTAAPMDSSTPDTASNTPLPTATNPPALTTTDSASPTVDPSETSSAEPTQQEAWSATPTLMAASSATAVLPTQTPTLGALSPTATPTLASVEKNTPTPEPQMATVESPSETPTPVGTSTTGDVLPTEEPTLLDSVQALSNDTSVVVLDQNGQPMPLAAQDAAEAVVNGDPMWCPNGVAPGGAGCTSNFFSMADLLTFASSYINSQNVNGTIWITSGNQIFEASAITIDGTTYPNWANQSITLQGGWSGVPGDTTIGANSVFSVPIQILNWNANVNINNITVSGASGSGLGVTTNGRRVAINNSRFINNSAGSGFFPWGDGADISPNGGNVIVTNSEFSGNNWDGLYIVNSGDISIRDSNLNSNGINNGYGGGLDAYGVNTIDIKNGEFNSNQSYDILASCNTGTFLNVSFLDLIRLDISVDQNCQVSAGLAVTPIPTLQSGITPTPTPTLQPGITPTPTPTQPAVIQPTQTIVPGTTSTPVPTPRGLPPIRRVVSSSGNTSRSKNTGEIFLECKLRPSFSYWLPNGDKVEIICPSDFWSGKAAISRLDNTSLPGELPAGYIYASAFQVDITQVKEPIQVIGGEIQRQSVDVIPEPGYIKASFVAPPIQVFGGTYSILYWDNGTWIPFKGFMLAENGGPQVFDLHPGSQEDPRKIIISGVEQVDIPRDRRIEVSTNFPGIYVLALH